MAPKLAPARTRPAGSPRSGRRSSSWGTSSAVRKRLCAALSPYSLRRSPGWVNATMVSAISRASMRLSSTVPNAAWLMKSPPSWTTRSGSRSSRRIRAGAYSVTYASRRSARLRKWNSVSSPGTALGLGSAHHGVS